MKITPTLPIPTLLPSDPGRKVSALRPANRLRHTLDGAGEHRTKSRQLPAPAEQVRVARQIETATRPPVPGPAANANRALAAYVEVAEGPERSRLRALLGFDDYA